MADRAADRRRQIPATGVLLQDPRLQPAEGVVGHEHLLRTIHAAQQMAREGTIASDRVADEVVRRLDVVPVSLTRVVNATGVIIHTNLGRSPLSRAAVRAVERSAGYLDLEFDLDTGTRSRRGTAAEAALLRRLPAAGQVMVVNNGAAALLLCLTALAGDGEVLWSRGELVEIGDGFRLHELAACSGARIHAVGTTNRTTIDDYRRALSADTRCILKVHPSNFEITGFTESASAGALSALGPPVLVDAGSGLLTPDPAVAGEPALNQLLADGADIVTASADKLLGGPQAGIIAGRAELVERLRHHPLARALRVGKLTLAALEATVEGPQPPIWQMIRTTTAELRQRAAAIAAATGTEVVASRARIGGGSAPGTELESVAVALPEECAAGLRTGTPVVVTRVDRGLCLCDLRSVLPDQDGDLIEAIRRCMS